MSALTRMNIDNKLIRLIVKLYEKAKFFVEIDGVKSNTYKQETGIRQGCPLSPYLFLIVMTVIFHDIHKDDKTKTKKHRVGEANLEEILYADDTICISEDAKALTRLLREIEKEGNKYGLRLNKDKCELIRIFRGGEFSNTDKVFFSSGQEVKPVAEAKYLGCWLNDKGDPEREVKQRVATCMSIVKKLDLFWKKANPSTKTKLITYDAIIRAKLLYGLESAAMNETVKHKLDVFQLKGLRKILNVKTTFVDRSKDNQTLLNMAQRAINHDTPDGKVPKELKKFSHIYEERKLRCLNKVITAEEGSPSKVMTFKKGTMQPLKVNIRPGTKRRIGKPRIKWVETGLEALWKLVGETIKPDVKNILLNLDNEEHTALLTQAATLDIHKKPNSETPATAQAASRATMRSAWQTATRPHFFSLAEAGLHIR
jgi:hypothetical protein